MTESPRLFVIHLEPGDLAHWLPTDRRVLRLWGSKLGPTAYMMLRLFYDDFVQLHAIPDSERSTHTMSFEYVGHCVAVPPSKVRATIGRLAHHGLLREESVKRWALPSMVPPLTAREYWVLSEEVRASCDWVPEPEPVGMPTRTEEVRP
jgi:hypothetical protein